MFTPGTLSPRCAKSALLLFSLLPVAATQLTAQEITRPDTLVTTPLGDVTNDPRVVAPQQALPGDAMLGLAPTARVAYAIWAEDFASGRVINFLRSVDGGFTWDIGQVTPIWTTVTGEILNTFSIKVHAEGHNVWITFQTRRDPLTGMSSSDNVAWVLASNDQGQTFQSLPASPGQFTPLPGGELLNRVLTVNSSATGGRLHVGFEADYDDVGTGAPGNDDDAYYQRFSFDMAGTLVADFPNERRVQTTAISSADVDTVQIAADGPLVVMTWEGPLNVESVVSNDGGMTFGSEVSHTSFSADEGIDPPALAVRGNQIVIVHADSSAVPTTGDLLYASVSMNAGLSFTNAVPLTAMPDVELPLYDVKITSGAAVIAWVDDSAGNEELRVISDTSGGILIGFGVFTVQTLLSPGGDGINIVDLDGLGSTFALGVSVGSSAGAEDAVVLTSMDAGANWTASTVNDFSVTGADTDELDVSVGANFDINVGVVRDTAGVGDVYMTGTKNGFLVDASPMGMGLQYHGPVVQVGSSVLFIGSLATPTSLGLVVDDPAGYALNFAIDGLSFDTALNPFFLQTIGADGVATLPLPNFAALFGITIHWIALPIDGVDLLRTYTDPLSQS